MGPTTDKGSMRLPTGEGRQAPSALCLRFPICVHAARCLPFSAQGWHSPPRLYILLEIPGLDPEKTQAALAAVERWRQEEQIP